MAAMAVMAADADPPPGAVLLAAGLVTHIPDRYEHTVRYYDHFSFLQQARPWILMGPPIHEKPEAVVRH
jgi:hypothetical protein